MWEEGPLGEELLPSDCPVAPSVVHFIDGYVMVLANGAVTPLGRWFSVV